MTDTARNGSWLAKLRTPARHFFCRHYDTETDTVYQISEEGWPSIISTTTCCACGKRVMPPFPTLDGRQVSSLLHWLAENRNNIPSSGNIKDLYAIRAQQLWGNYD